MNVIKNTNGRREIKPVLTLMAIAASACIAQGQTGFLEDFTGPTLDPNWQQNSYAAGHLGIIAGSYYMTALQGGGFNPKLVRSTTGPLDTTYTHEISVALDPFFLTGSGGTQSDFKWKSFGADGFMEIVLNSFGDMRLYHEDFNDAVGGGNIQPNTNIGISEGDVLSLKSVYDKITDTVSITYSLNAGGDVPFYSGGGISGPVGDTIGNFVEVEVFKWGAVADVPYIGIDEWNLTHVPEPTSVALLGLGSLSLLFLRRRS